MVMPDVLPDLPRVRPVNVLGIVRLLVVNADVNEFATGLMVSAPVLVKMVGDPSKVTMSASKIKLELLLVTREPSAPKRIALADAGLK